jgi:membrane protease YdiL (CAAX protease family)
MNVPFFSNKYYWQQFLYLLLFIVGGITIFSSLSLLMVKLFEIETGTKYYIYIMQSVGSFGVFLVPALLFSYCATKDWFSYSKSDKIFPLSWVSYVLPLSLFILPVIACLGYFNEQIVFPNFLHNIETWMREMEKANAMLAKTLTHDSTLPVLFTNIVIMALFPALFEEFLFRGTLQPFFTKWFANKHVAIIVTAFIFSAIHFQFFGFIPRFLLGIYLGYLFVWGKSLWLPIVAHFLHNALSIIGDYSAQHRNIDLDTIDPTQIQAFYPVALFSAICVGLLIYLMWKKTKINYPVG